MANGMMRARLTRHARIAMTRRGIEERDVRRVLKSPQAVVATDRPGRQIFQGLATLGDPPREVLLRVVVDSNRSPPDVITVYATTQFRRYAAKP